MVKPLPQSKAPTTDIHRFWEQTGSFYARGMGNDNITDPVHRARRDARLDSALFRDMTGIRFQHPEWIAENCTACGKLLHGLPGHRDPRPGQRGRPGLRHGRQARAQARPRRRQAPAEGGAR